LTNAVVQALAINPSGHIFVGSEGIGVFRSLDDGNTWDQIDAGLTNKNVRSIAINSSGHIYVGTAEGVFRSKTDGDTWDFFNTGLTNTDVRFLGIRDSDGKTFVGTVGGLFWTAPLIEHRRLQLLPGGEQISITADITGLDTVSLNYRKSGDREFIPVPVSKLGISYQGTIPAGFVTSRGVEYFIFAQNSSGSTKLREPASGFFSISIQVDSVSKSRPQPGGSARTDYRLISMPLDLINPDAGAVLQDELGRYNSTAWRFFELKENQEYAELSSTSLMIPGKAFWLIVKEPGKIISSGAGNSNPTSEAYAIELHPRWNFIANPFNFAIPASNVRLKSSGISPELRAYEESWNNRDLAPLDSIQPFEGYAVFNNLNSTDWLLVDPDLSSSPGSLSRRSARSGENCLQWSIRIFSQCQEAQDVDNVAAVAEQASKTWDVIDSPEPPIIGEYVSVYFPHRDWKTLGKTYCIDARPNPAQAGEIWELEVKTNIRDKVDLTFAGLESVPREFEVWLTDDALRLTQNLRELNVSTVAGSEHPKSLKLVVGKKDFVKEKLGLTQLIPTHYEISQNFPNPFNPVTTIRYGLPQAGRVSLKIYNLLGEEVAMLVNEEQKAAGYHVAIWNGKDGSGNAVASGVYVYRLHAENFSSSRKLALVK
jgi:hypothetical protein